MLSKHFFRVCLFNHKGKPDKGVCQNGIHKRSEWWSYPKVCQNEILGV